MVQPTTISPTPTHKDPCTVACTYCDRVRNAAGEWTCVCAHDLIEQSPISHGVCPTCLDAARMDLLVEVVCELCTYTSENEPRPLVHAM